MRQNTKKKTTRYTSFINIEFYKNNRKNAKLIRSLTLGYDRYNIDLLYNAIDYYDIAVNVQRARYLKITVSQHYKTKDNMICNDIYMTLFERSEYHTIEQYISLLTKACVVAINGQSWYDLSGVFEDITVRKKIKKFYDKYCNRGNCDNTIGLANSF